MHPFFPRPPRQDDIITVIDARKFKATKIQKFNHEVNEFTWDNAGKYLFMTTELGSPPPLPLGRQGAANLHLILSPLWRFTVHCP